jgi:hypothetical protein
MNIFVYAPSEEFVNTMMWKYDRLLLIAVLHSINWFTVDVTLLSTSLPHTLLDIMQSATLTPYNPRQPQSYFKKILQNNFVCCYIMLLNKLILIMMSY